MQFQLFLNNSEQIESKLCLNIVSTRYLALSKDGCKIPTQINKNKNKKRGGGEMEIWTKKLLQSNLSAWGMPKRHLYRKDKFKVVTTKAMCISKNKELCARLQRVNEKLGQYKLHNIQLAYYTLYPSRELERSLTFPQSWQSAPLKLELPLQPCQTPQEMSSTTQHPDQNYIKCNSIQGY